MDKYFNQDGTALTDAEMPYPRICAHRGAKWVAPENSLPSHGIAVAMGAQEIEFDLYSTKDDVLIAFHDTTLDRTTTGTGNVWEYTYEELLKLDCGVKFDEKFSGLKIVTFEELLQKFAKRVIMNIHVKIWDLDQPDDKMDEIVAMLRKYDCEKYMYFMSCRISKIQNAKARYPELRCCLGYDKTRLYEHAERAVEAGADKAQFVHPWVTQEMIDKAHANGTIVNIYKANDLQSAIDYLNMGADCILTDNYLEVRKALESRKAYTK